MLKFRVVGHMLDVKCLESRVFPNTEFNQDRLWETSTVLIKVVSYVPPLIY